MLLPWWAIRLTGIDVDRPGSPSSARSRSRRHSSFVPRRYALALPLVVARLLVAVVASRSGRARTPTASSRPVPARSSRGSAAPRDWIDDAVPEGDEVAVLWTGRSDRFTVNRNEFFNRSVGQVYYIGAPTPGGAARSGRASTGDGAVRLADGPR